MLTSMLNNVLDNIVEILIISIAMAILVRLQFRYRFLQYVFFLRAPLTHAAILLLLPLAVRTTAFAPLFVVTPTQLAIVTFLLILSTWAVTSAWGLVFVGAAPRFRLKFHQPDLNHEQTWDVEAPPNTLMGLLATERRRAYILPILLGAPIVAVCVWRSPGSGPLKALAIGGGVAAAVAARELTVWCQERFQRWLHAPEPSMPASRLLNLRRWLLESIYRFGDTALGGAFKWAFASGYADLADDRRMKENPTPLQERPAAFSHWRAAAFAVLALLVYVAGWFVLDPSQRHWLIDQTPALAYVLMVVTLFGLTLPAVTFFLDFYRVPLLVVVVLILFLSYRYSDLDHYYEFAGPKEAVRFTELPAPEFVGGWVNAHPQAVQRPMVVIAASGGGSHSARWTTEVLKRLREHQGLGGAFFDSIAFISAVSGGSLGTMYAVEQFKEGSPTVENLEKARDAASHSNVGALAWGLAYPDLVRKVFPRIFFHQPGGLGLFDARHDRAWALEQTWRSVLDDSKGTATLGGWIEDVRNGRKPAVVFNATLMETGERFLLSGITIPNSRATQFAQRYPKRDLSVVTAVRLSAAFPFLSPIARPVQPYRPGTEEAKAFDTHAYHVADGGYYDGSGTLTAIEFIDAVLDEYRRLGGRKVVLVEIRTAIESAAEAQRHTNWLAALAGPLSTARNASTSSQVSRTAFELDLLKRRWKNPDLPEDKQVTIESVVFHLNGAGTLPWHLSADEQKKISNEWVDNKANPKALAKLEAFFNSP
jgi:hypothetical protein